jgi:hypothetical protein
MNGYFVRHAVYLTLMTGAGGLLWIIFCFALGLPFHPWCSAAIGLFVATTLFWFAGLDAGAMRIMSRIGRFWEWLVLVCVILAAIFGARGGPFPFWALLPILICSGVLAAVVTFFGVRTIVRLLIDPSSSGHLCIAPPGPIMTSDPVRFVPSRVDGFANVATVTVFPDRIELALADGATTHHFTDIARWPTPGPLWKLAYWLGLKPWSLPVADRSWFQPTGGYFEFYTTPRLRVHMPVDDGRDYLTSCFLRIQQVLGRGNFHTRDLN